jgi:hypothetical protein
MKFGGMHLAMCKLEKGWVSQSACLENHLNEKRGPGGKENGSRGRDVRDT